LLRALVAASVSEFIKNTHTKNSCGDHRYDGGGDSHDGFVTIGH